MERAYGIRFSPAVKNIDLYKIDRPVKERILKTIRMKLASNPVEFSKSLSGSLKNFRSMRVGSYRVIFSVEEEIITVHIIAIGHREDVYDFAKDRLN